jgi:hypothetical protein
MAQRRRATGVGRRDAADEGGDDAAPSVDALVAWIPGEVIAFYTALVLAFQPQQEGDTAPPLEITSEWWLIIAVLLAAGISWLGGWSRATNLTGAQTVELALRSVLAAFAFALWSFVVPGSWWYSIDDIAENQDVVLLVAGVAAVMFSLFAEGIVRRVAPD